MVSTGTISVEHEKSKNGKTASGGRSYTVDGTELTARFTYPPVPHLTAFAWYNSCEGKTFIYGQWENGLWGPFCMTVFGKQPVTKEPVDW